jgi:hypothetical protein
MIIVKYCMISLLPAVHTIDACDPTKLAGLQQTPAYQVAAGSHHYAPRHDDCDASSAVTECTSTSTQAHLLQLQIALQTPNNSGNK